VSATVRVKDNGLNERLAELKSIGGKVAIGVLGSTAGKSHGATTLYDVAAANEFGTSRIPERSFLRGTFDANRAKVVAFCKKQGLEVARGNITNAVALERIGAFVQGLIQLRIAAGIPPANKQSTIDRKGSSKPLIDSGQLRSSITYEVRK
jgi:hypothetical protein